MALLLPTPHQLVVVKPRAMVLLEEANTCLQTSALRLISTAIVSALERTQEVVVEPLLPEVVRMAVAVFSRQLLELLLFTQVADSHQRITAQMEQQEMALQTLAGVALVRQGSLAL
jgi:hypothetical protein|tara:strand:+ start:1146 stop:1493 length:348 start_codon:yes stop_codon:yes gene_type:complete